MFDRFLEFVVDRVLSFETLMLFVLGGLFFGAYLIIVNDMERTGRMQTATEFCYSQNMVLVNSDAGVRCVEPSALVKTDV